MKSPLSLPASAQALCALSILSSAAVAQPWTGGHSTFGDGTAILGDIIGADGQREVLIGIPGLNRCEIYQLGQAAPSRIHTAGSGLFGATVANLGDVNGDGVSDYAIGAPADIYGRVTIFSGANGTQIQTIAGPAASRWFGHRIVSVGDINNDGTPDFAVSAPTGSTGAIYVYQSSAVGFGQTTYSPLTTGSMQTDYLGDSLTFVGGNAATIAAGAPDEMFNGVATGAAYAWDLLGTNRNQRRFAPSGTGVQRFGASVAAIQSPSGPRLVVGAPWDGANQRGTVGFYDVSTQAFLYAYIALTNFQQAGEELATLDDLNGDGTEEVIAGGASGAYRILNGNFGAVYKLIGSSSFGSIATGDLHLGNRRDILLGSAGSVSVAFAAYAQSMGTGCSTETLFSLPVLSSTSNPVLGTPTGLRVTAIYPAAAAGALWFSAPQAAPIQIGNCNWYVDLAGVVSMSFALDNTVTQATHTFLVPNTPSLAGIQIVNQAVIVSPMQKIDTTNAVTLRLGDL